MSVTAGQAIAKSDLDTLATLANSKVTAYPFITEGGLPTGHIDTGGTPSAFSFGATSGWRTELSRIRECLKYKLDTAPIVEAQAASGPWPLITDTTPTLSTYVSEYEGTMHWLLANDGDRDHTAAVRYIAQDGAEAFGFVVYEKIGTSSLIPTGGGTGTNSATYTIRFFNPTAGSATWALQLAGYAEGAGKKYQYSITPTLYREPTASYTGGSGLTMDYVNNWPTLANYLELNISFSGTLPAGWSEWTFTVTISQEVNDGVSGWIDDITFLEPELAVITGTFTSTEYIETGTVAPYEAVHLSRLVCHELNFDGLVAYAKAQTGVARIWCVASHENAGTFHAQTRMQAGGWMNPKSAEIYPNADERIARFSPLTHGVINPYAPLPAPYPPARFLVGYQQDGSGDAFYNGSKDHYRGNTDYNYGFGDDLTAPHSPSQGTYFRTPLWYCRKDTKGDFSPFTAWGLYGANDFGEVWGGCIYSITARRKAVRRGLFNVQPSQAESVEVTIGTFISGVFTPILNMAIEADTPATTVYPRCLVIFSDMPLFYQCASGVHVTANYTGRRYSSALNETLSIYGDEEAGETFQTNVSWPVMAHHYNDAETLLNLLP